MPVPYNDWLGTLERKATLRDRAGLRRSATPRAPAVDLAGNDYLGLSRHPSVTAAASAALTAYGLGATGSRLVRGTTDLHQALEQELSFYVGTEKALVYSSGYLANLGAIRALAGLSPRTRLVSDAHCHASMIDGCRLSGAETMVFRHGDVAHAESLLLPSGPNVILTESIFSVDGDLAPLAQLHAMARANGALLLVDDAHGLGVNEAVRSIATEPDVIITATLSKALGGAGGVVAGPAALIDHLIDTSRTFIFDTALPPAIAAGVLAALDITRAADDLRALLHTRAASLAELPIAPGLAAPGVGVAGVGVAGVAGPGIGAARRGWLPPGGVVSIRAATAQAALGWASACRAEGVAVGCFRPPSTPDGSSRLRLTVNAGVPESEFAYALEVIEKCRPSAE